MKRIYTLIALLGFVACLALTGCDQGSKPDGGAPGADTNAPAATTSTNK